MILFKRDFEEATFTVYGRDPIGLNINRVKQVHGTAIVKAPSEFIEADGLYSLKSEHQRLCVLTADCLPVFVWGKRGYALVHAGWKGVATGILLQPEIKKIVPQYFFVGPHIHSCCYEVQQEFLQNFPTSNSFIKRENKIFFDLGLELEKSLKQKYPKAEVEICKSCTCCNKIFHSFRRDKTEKRNWNVIEIKRK